MHTIKYEMNLVDEDGGDENECDDNNHYHMLTIKDFGSQEFIIDDDENDDIGFHDD
jgi:hypothetical protein